MPKTSPDVLTIREAANRLRVHENTIRNYMDRGIIRFYQLPSGIRRVLVSEVHRLEAEMYSVPSVTGYDRTPTKPPKAVEDQGPRIEHKP